MKAGDIEFLQQIAEYEKTLDFSKEGMNLGWNWRDIRIQPAVLNRFFLEGYLENPFKSNSYTGYLLSEKGKALVEAEEMGTTVEGQPQEFELPDDLFSDIIGHDDVKELLKACLKAERPVHVLLAGPPALAKTLFLWDIERVAGNLAVWLVGSATSKAGLWDLVAEKQPRLLLIDELDKMNAADTAALLSMMEGGRLVRAKRGRELDLVNPLWIVAATNKLYGLSPELLSRFAVRKITAYTRSDYYSVVKGVLVRREDADESLAEDIAHRLDGMSQDVRDAVRVARLAPQLGVETAINLLLGQQK